MDSKSILFASLSLVLALYLFTFIRGGLAIPTVFQTALGFVTAFLDTLGIGSFATTTTVFRLRRMVPVNLIPGTLNVGHSLPTIAQAYIYTKIVPVEPRTLSLMIVAAVVGSWIGVSVVVHWPRRKIQIGMGIALIAAAILMLMQALKVFPVGGSTLALGGGRLVIGLLGNFVLGMLNMLGIGLYAPCMVLVTLLGMSPAAAFPIMMGSCAFLMPISSLKFVPRGAYHRQAALGLAVGAVPGVLVAAFGFRSMSLDALRWLIVIVVVYTAFNLLLTEARRERTK